MGKSRVYPLKPGVHTVPCGTEMHRIHVSPKNRIRLLDHDVSMAHVLADLRMNHSNEPGAWSCAHAVGFMVGMEELQDKLVLADTAYVTRLVGILRDEDDYLDDVRFTSPLPNRVGKEDREWPSRLGPAALREARNCFRIPVPEIYEQVIRTRVGRAVRKMRLRNSSDWKPEVSVHILGHDEPRRVVLGGNWVLVSQTLLSTDRKENGKERPKRRASVEVRVSPMRWARVALLGLDTVLNKDNHHYFTLEVLKVRSPFDVRVRAAKPSTGFSIRDFETDARRGSDGKWRVV